MVNKLISYAKELKKEFETQDTDGQAYPRFWVIKDYKTVPTAEGYHEFIEVYVPYLADVLSVDEYKKQITERLGSGEFSEDVTEELQNILCYYCTGSSVLEQIIELTGGDCHVVYSKVESFVVPNTFFLTKQDAKDYLKRYGYNHSPKAHTYAMTALRSPKYQKLIDLIMEVE